MQDFAERTLGMCDGVLIGLKIWKDSMKETFLEKFSRDERGADLVETIVAIAIFAAICFAIYNLFGDALLSKGNEVSSQIMDSGNKFNGN